MNSISTPEDVQRVIAEYDREHPPASNNSQQWWAAIDQRIVQHLEQWVKGAGRSSALIDAIGEVIAIERKRRREEVKAVVEAGQRAIEAKLEALEQRLKAVTGKLPVAKTWRPESVTYQAELVCHEGALYQARQDTAQAPGGPDWVCVARAGRDALTPNCRGTYKPGGNYKYLDIVVLNGDSFIARKADPGPCPSDGWQLIAARGPRGEKGLPGPRGEKGERGEPSSLIVGWEIDRPTYRAFPVLADGQLGPELNLRELFERYHEEAH
jgi:hypothetical protein